MSGSDIKIIDIELHLIHHEFGPLAEWIEQGGDLTPRMRMYLVDLLRGNIEKGPRGRKRTLKQESREMAAASYLMKIEECLLLENGGKDYKGRKTKALERAAEELGISTESMKLYAKRERELRGIMKRMTLTDSPGKN